MSSAVVVISSIKVNMGDRGYFTDIFGSGLITDGTEVVIFSWAGCKPSVILWNSTGLSTSFEKTFFCSALYSKWKCSILINHILSETICLFCFCALFSNIYCKINFTTQNGLTYAISIVNWIFGKKLLEINFLLFFRILNYFCSITILWKLQKFWTSGICWKPASKLSTLSIFCLICSHFHYWKNGLFWKFRKALNRIKVFVHR